MGAVPLVLAAGRAVGERDVSEGTDVSVLKAKIQEQWGKGK